MLKNKTLKEILENPIIAEIAPDAIRGRDLSREEFYHWTLQEISDKVGWGNLERGVTKLLEVAARGEYYFKLYSEEECLEVPSRKGPKVGLEPT